MTEHIRLVRLGLLRALLFRGGSERGGPVFPTPVTLVTGVVRWTTAQLDPASAKASGFGILLERPPDAFLEFFEDLLLH